MLVLFFFPFPFLFLNQAHVPLFAPLLSLSPKWNPMNQTFERWDWDLLMVDSILWNWKGLDFWGSEGERNGSERAESKQRENSKLSCRNLVPASSFASTSIQLLLFDFFLGTSRLAEQIGLAMLLLGSGLSAERFLPVLLPTKQKELRNLLLTQSSLSLTSRTMEMIKTLGLRERQPTLKITNHSIHPIYPEELLSLEPISVESKHKHKRRKAISSLSSSLKIETYRPKTHRSG